MFVTPQLTSSLPHFATLMFDGLEQGPDGVVRVALGGDPVEAADVPAQEALAAGVEDPHRPQPDAGRHADDAAAVVDRADRARDVRPVPVAVAPGVAVRGRAVVAADDVQVGRAADAGVDDRDVGVDPLVDAVDRATAARGRRSRLIPVGIDLCLGAMFSSATIIATDGSWLRAVTWPRSSCAEKPRSASRNVRSDVEADPLALASGSVGRVRARASGRRSSGRSGSGARPSGAGLSGVQVGRRRVVRRPDDRGRGMRSPGAGSEVGSGAGSTAGDPAPRLRVRLGRGRRLDGWARGR